MNNPPLAERLDVDILIRTGQSASVAAPNCAVIDEFVAFLQTKRQPFEWNASVQVPTFVSRLMEEVNSS